MAHVGVPPVNPGNPFPFSGGGPFLGRTMVEEFLPCGADGLTGHISGFIKDSGFNQFLVIVWILLILVTNALLLGGLAFDPAHDNIRGLLRSSRRWVLATLAFGDILMAFFPLLIVANLILRDEQDPAMVTTCESRRISDIYGVSFFPFVYTLALIILACELHMRDKINSMIKEETVSSLVLAAIPWLVGLVFIFTMNFAGYKDLTADISEKNLEQFEKLFPFYYERACCIEDFTVHRYNAIIVLGIILPCIAAAVFAFIPNRGAPGDETQALQVVAVATAILYLFPALFRRAPSGLQWVVIEGDDPDAVHFGYDFFYWLHYSRSFITPLLWLVMLWRARGRGGNAASAPAR